MNDEDTDEEIEAIHKMFLTEYELTEYQKTMLKIFFDTPHQKIEKGGYIDLQSPRRGS